MCLKNDQTINVISLPTLNDKIELLKFIFESEGSGGHRQQFTGHMLPQL